MLDANNRRKMLVGASSSLAVELAEFTCTTNPSDQVDAADCELQVQANGQLKNGQTGACMTQQGPGSGVEHTDHICFL